MEQQLTLPAVKDEEEPLKFVDPGDVDRLMEVLKDQGWMHAREICDLLHPWFDRKVRAVAQASEGLILSGQNGYKLTVACTPEEVRLATGWLRSQAKCMWRRSVQIHRVFFGAVKREPEQEAAQS